MTDAAPPPPADGDTAAILAPPPVLTIGGLVVWSLLEWLAPLPAPELSPGWRLGVGCGQALAGLAIAGWAFRTLRAHRTSPAPTRPTRALVTTGPYALSRNPLYLALLLGHAAIAWWAASTWLLLGVPVLFALLHLGVVRPEERYLLARFPAEYEAYRRRVRRWL